jgi:SAM-dependent methyltransferase
MSNYTNIEQCVVCGSEKVSPYLNLGMQPLANSYHKGNELAKYPLAVQFCSVCNHSMLTASVNPEAMFTDYLYISDTSETLKKYFEGLCDKICEKNPNAGSVLEIACNSGLFLEMFSNKGLSCFGVDPAANLRTLSEGRGLDVDVNFWNLDYAEKLKGSKTFDIICAIHVLPHVPNPVNFLKACKAVLNNGGKIYVQTSQCDMFLNNEFDAIYHEHVSYFTASSFIRAAEEAGLLVSDAWKAPIHSKSFVFELTNHGFHGSSVLAMRDQELGIGRGEFSSYENFAKDATKIKDELYDLIQHFKDQGMKVVGYGASAKGNTLMNWAKFKLDYIVDDSNFKWDYLTPGMDIPIKSPDVLFAEVEPVVILCLAWNFFDEISDRVKQNSKHKNKFITYFPCVQTKD